MAYSRENAVPIAVPPPFLTFGPKTECSEMEETKVSKIKACFILEESKYIEVPVAEVLEHGRYKDKFENRYFFRFGGYLLEMSREDRRFFYDCQESMAHMVRQPKKQVKTDKQIQVVSLDELMEGAGDGNMRLDFLRSEESDPAEETEHRVLAEALKAHRKKLSSKEDQLLTECFEEGKSDRALAKQYRVNQSTITKRRRRILDKLLNFLENK